MPTGRTFTFISAALLLYLFANQTQVGWLYVMSAVLGGTVLAAFILNRLSLGKLRISRAFHGEQDDLHEGDTVTVEVTYTHLGGAPSAQVLATETCPLAEPTSDQTQFNVYIPSLPKKTSQSFEYTLKVYRRGIQHFDPAHLTSKAPFGLFKRRKTIQAVTPILIYPQLKRLKRLALLDKQPTPQIAASRSGLGSEVIGVRPYKSGDSPRHIHWRSVARTGRLISKEFAEETRPGVTLLLDLFQYPYPQAQSKHTSFEWAVKSAVSIGDYALRRRYPLHLAAAFSPPHGEITQRILLEYLARIEPIGKRPLEELIEGSALQTFVALILPWPAPEALTAIEALHQRGLETLAVVINPASFPAGGPDATLFAGTLQAAEVDVALIEYGTSWAAQLEAAVPHDYRESTYV